MALGDLPIGDDAWITLLVRDCEALRPDSDLEPCAEPEALYERGVA